MEGVMMLIFLSITMLVGSFVSGLVPLALNLSEAKMRHITILGAGLLIGTALAVIIPEGIHALYASNNSHHSDSVTESHNHVHKRSADIFDNHIITEDDKTNYQIFLNALNQNNNHVDVINKRAIITEQDKKDYEIFLNQLGETINQVPVINKRSVLTEEDKKNYEIFLNQLSENNNHIPIINKRSAWTDEDKKNYEIFLNQLNENNNQVPVINKRSTWTEEDQKNYEIFLNQLNENNNQVPVINRRNLQKRSALTGAYASAIGGNLYQLPLIEKRDKRAEPIKSAIDKQHELEASEQLKIKKGIDSPEKLLENEHSHNHESTAHSAIGVTLVLGFVFMLIIDQIGGKFSHRSHQILDTQAIRNKITFTTTLGLVVHAAADGIALGAAAATSKTDVEMIVFVAIMLHKAPAAFGLVSFLIHEGLDRSRVRKHLVIFAIAAPVMALFTFMSLRSNRINEMLSSDSTGLCMLFSAGTFLYVSTVHVLPEVQSHNEDRQFRFGEMLSFIIGAILPLFLSIGHSH